MPQFERHLAKAELHLNRATKHMHAAEEAREKTDQHLAQANELIDAAQN